MSFLNLDQKLEGILDTPDDSQDDLDEDLEAKSKNKKEKQLDVELKQSPEGKDRMEMVVFSLVLGVIVLFVSSISLLVTKKITVNKKKALPSLSTQESEANYNKTYENETVGFAFAYPDSWALEEVTKDVLRLSSQEESALLQEVLILFVDTDAFLRSTQRQTLAQSISRFCRTSNEIRMSECGSEIYDYTVVKETSDFDIYRGYIDLAEDEQLTVDFFLVDNELDDSVAFISQNKASLEMQDLIVKNIEILDENR